MPESTYTSVSFPITPEPNDKRPLPEIIADYCGFPLAFVDVDGERFYAVQDWLRGVAQPVEITKFW